MTLTPEDLIKGASSIARDAADGKLDPATLEAQLVTELRSLFGTVVGEDDSLWPLQVEVAAGVLAAGGIPTDELAEWLAVQRRRENPEEALSVPVPIHGSDTPSEANSSGSGELSPEYGPADNDDDFSDLPREVIAEAEQAAMAIINEWREAQR